MMSGRTNKKNTEIFFEIRKDHEKIKPLLAMLNVFAVGKNIFITRS